MRILILLVVVSLSLFADIKKDDIIQLIESENKAVSTQKEIEKSNEQKNREKEQELKSSKTLSELEASSGEFDEGNINARLKAMKNFVKSKKSIFLPTLRSVFYYPQYQYFENHENGTKTAKISVKTLNAEIAKISNNFTQYSIYIEYEKKIDLLFKLKPLAVRKNKVEELEVSLLNSSMANNSSSNAYTQATNSNVDYYISLKKDDRLSDGMRVISLNKSKMVIGR